ncbi:MAG: M81 family metallopeptidase, partial [Pseudomonadales bacterium]
MSRRTGNRASQWNTRQMRIAIAGISHETNSYCQANTFVDDFYQLRGDKFLATFNQESDIGGAVAACNRMDVTPVPILFVSAQPSGIIDHGTYQRFKSEIIEGLAAATDIDGVVLCLHGAGVVDGIEDLEGDLCGSVREVFGAGFPITASFDLHGNITQSMADALDGMFACHHYPHIDLHERAAEAVELAVRIRRESLTTATWVTTVPMLLPTTTTFIDPGKRRLRMMLEAEQEAGVIDVSWFHGFPYTDVGHIGCYIVVTTEGDAAQARRIGTRLAHGLWADRELFRPDSLSAADAVTTALQASR